MPFCKHFLLCIWLQEFLKFKDLESYDVMRVIIITNINISTNVLNGVSFLQIAS